MTHSKAAGFGGVQGRRPWPCLIFSADDYGLSPAVNQAIDQACRQGVLRSASLMVAGDAAADAVARARRLPALHVGLHLVLVDGPAVLPHSEIPDLVDADGRFSAAQLRRGFSYFFRPRVRRQLAREIEAQFAAYAATGLPLDHADAHKHMHLHPTVGRLMIEIGARYGLRALRVPAEPPAVLRACGARTGLGAAMLYRWSRLLRRQARRAGLAVNDHAFGIAWTGHMTRERVARLLEHLPPGVSELYFHPATAQDALLARLMPGYEHAEELRTLLSLDVEPARLTHYGALAAQNELHAGQSRDIGSGSARRPGRQ